MNKAKILSVVKRNNISESYHYGWFIVLDENNKIVLGSNKEYPKIFLRSTIKPVQALPLLYSKAFNRLKITDKELAIICSSHSGEKIHTNLVKSIMKKINLENNYLKCGIHQPLDKYTNDKLIRYNKNANVLHCNCSGKHSGMLAVCLENNWDINNYYEYNHLLQVEIRKYLLELSEEKEENMEWGIDGCGLPTYSINFKNLAILFKNLGSLKSKEFELIRNSFLKYPYLIAGKDRNDTLLMEVLKDKLISKSGGEAVIVLYLLDEKLSIVLKVADGSQRSILPIIISILEKLGINNKELKELKNKNSYIYNNDNKLVGNIEVVLSY